MRLIDADDLIITILTHDLCDTEQIDKDILEAPTVDAIPVEWLRKQLDRYECSTYEGIETVLELWEKENEMR